MPYMKRLFSIFCVLALVAGLAACGGKNKDEETNPWDLPEDGGIDAPGTNGEIDGTFGTDIPIRPEGGDPLGAVPGIEPVFFGFDSSSVSPAETYKLEVVVQHMNNNPGVSVIVEGHSDERGSREYNVALSERRALSVLSYLINMGINGNRIQTRAMGEESPAVFGHDESAWSQNRRAEFIFTK